MGWLSVRYEAPWGWIPRSLVPLRHGHAGMLNVGLGQDVLEPQMHPIRLNMTNVTESRSRILNCKPPSLSSVFHQQRGGPLAPPRFSVCQKDPSGWFAKDGDWTLFLEFVSPHLQSRLPSREQAWLPRKSEFSREQSSVNRFNSKKNCTHQSWAVEIEDPRPQGPLAQRLSVRPKLGQQPLTMQWKLRLS